MTIGPNGIRVLQRLGVDIEKLAPVEMKSFKFNDIKSLKQTINLDIGHLREKFGSYTLAVHRADLHRELLRLATAEDESTGQPPAQIYLGAVVTNIDVENACIKLATGETFTADLLIGADGLHSAVRQAAIPGGEPPFDSGLVVHRFLLSEDEIMSDDKLVEMRDRYSRQSWHSGPDGDEFLVFVWFECRRLAALFLILSRR